MMRNDRQNGCKLHLLTIYGVECVVEPKVISCARRLGGDNVLNRQCESVILSYIASGNIP